ncbi:NADPH-dependent F420 reductase [Rothia terrae]|uniref:NADPH-dependent F420 reductase n=1 Tax=Rothia terrae TaxID=396015 RepID=UPI002882412D|nr:NAD(P)-binding domain-containing protein [Rothia terrae]MDT0188742.1 NAD(P)-binding domain-containing protein [Rothia terrae]
MKVGIIGTGNIGGTLARKLASKGHDVKVANSRGPETIDASVLSTGARAATADDAVHQAEVIIIAVPLTAYAALKSLLHTAPEQAIVVDTGNYYPGIFGKIDELEDGQVQAVWAQEQLGRPIIKAWNAVLAGRLAEDFPASALPVAGDSHAAKQVVFSLVKDTGFDPVDGGTSADAWRQQPGSPAYCTSLSSKDLEHSLTQANQQFLAQRRELILEIIADRAAQDPEAITVEYVTAVNRLVTAGTF